MLTLYGMKNSRSARVVWLLEELKVPYELKLFYAPKSTQGVYPASLKEMVPGGEIPALKLEDGTFIQESGFIMQYIMDKYGKGSHLAPRNDQEWQQIQSYLFAAEANFVTTSLMILIHREAAKMSPPGVSFLLRKFFDYVDSFWAMPKTVSLVQQLENKVKENKGYLVGGHLTAADIMYSFNLQLVFDKGILSESQFPELSLAWEQWKSRPAYIAAMKQDNKTPDFS